jgi:hypothetical protein
MGVWTLEDALPIIRAIAPIAERCGFSVALRGSVLIKGRSEKDLDLLFVEEEPDICDVRRCLDEIAGLLEVRIAGPPHTCSGGHCAVIRLTAGRHIDAQFRHGCRDAENASDP